VDWIFAIESLVNGAGFVHQEWNANYEFISAIGNKQCFVDLLGMPVLVVTAQPAPLFGKLKNTRDIE